jgi:cytochrome c-type biogenesis protein CcmH/NrfF
MSRRLRLRGAPWRLLLAAGLLALVVFGGWRATAAAPPTLDQKVADVASGLRCPSCEGQSVAASESDLARQMRLVARQQLAAGRSEAQVRAWFAQRYGDGVLLDPPAHGLGLVAFAVPVVVVAAGVGLLVRFLRGPGRLAPAASAGTVVVLGGLAVAVAAASQAGTGPASEAAGLAAVRTAATASPALPLPPQAVVPSGSATASGSASTSASASQASAVRQALAALEAGDAAQAEQLAQRVLSADGVPAGTKADALLVLGLAQRALGDPAGDVTLRRFLEQAPDHPAAGKVRALLGSTG